MKKETVQKSHEMYKKKIEEKKLADEMIIHDIHLTPMIFDADSSFYYTYFKINSLKDWELLKKVYDFKNASYKFSRNYYCGIMV